MDSFYLGAYWGNRPESAARCGVRLAKCVASLSVIDVALGSWYLCGESLETAFTPVAPDPESLSQILTDGVFRRDRDDVIIEELGFTFEFWNGSKPTVALSGAVGAYPSFSGIVNRLLLEFSPPEDEALRLYEPSVAEAILDAVIDAWDPTWATWTSNSLRKVQGAAPREPVIGWMTYLTMPIGTDIPGAGMRSLSGGTAIRIGRDVRQVDEIAVLKVRNQLAKVEGLNPIP